MENSYYDDEKRGSVGATSYLPPDYSGSPSEDDEEDDEFLTEDESGLEKYLDEQCKKDDNKMDSNQQTPFGTPIGSGSSSPWWSNNNSSNNNSGSSWGTWRTSNNNNQPSWMNNNQPPSWQRTDNNVGSNWWGNTNQQSSQPKIEINRQKRFIICDILDCLVETYQSNGYPGLMPRGIYDIRLRFEVWSKLAAFNPEKVFTMIPRSLISSEGGYSFAWDTALNYITCSLSEYLRIPYKNCQILLQHTLNQQEKVRILEPLIKDYGYDKRDMIYVGIYSGLQGQSDRDIIAAKRLDLDYVDINQLLNNMY